MPVSFKPPRKCSDPEREDFARLVRAGFAGSDDGLEDRIRSARLLAFHSEGGALVGIAGLKVPARRYRDVVFAEAETGAPPTDYAIELGWVYVDPERRGNGIGESLCRELLAFASAPALYATTRPDNTAMIKILRRLGFLPTGRPFAHVRRNEQLILFLR